MKEIRVLHIGLSSNVGGIETVVHSWLKYKPEWLHFDFVQIGENHIAFENKFIDCGSRIYRITPRAVNAFKSNTDLKRAVSNNNYDYVQHHIMSYSWPETVLVTNKYSNSKMVLHAHTVITNQFSMKAKALHMIGKIRLAKQPFLEIACSEEAGTAMFHENGFTVIRNGIDFSERRFDKSERDRVRNILGYCESDIVIGHVGRSAFEKNYPYLLKSFKILHSRNKNTKLLLIGDILEDGVIQKLIDDLAIRDVTTCTGKVRNTVSYYSAMDIFFLPSMIEGVSVSLLEAQASGLPCVISENVSKESIISGLCKSITINDPKKTADYLLSVIDNPLKSRINIDLDTKYDLKRTSEELFEFYRNNLEK